MVYLLLQTTANLKNRRRTGAFQQIYLKEMITITTYTEIGMGKGLRDSSPSPIARKGTDKCHRVHHKCVWKKRHISKSQKHFHTPNHIDPSHVGNHGNPKMLNIFYITPDK